MYPPEIDHQLSDFSGEHGLHVIRRHRDEEVRSMTVTDDQDTNYQIWLSETQGRWTVHAWDFGDQRIEILGDNHEVGRALEGAMSQVDLWIEKRGHTRRVS
jgi:hypothetical protein